MTSKEDSFGEDKTTKSFDKSKWRKNKYSHKNKLQQFEEKRRKAALHKYYKELKKSEQISSRSEENPVPTTPKSQKSLRYSNPYEKAKQELARRQEEKEQLRAEKEKQKAEKEEALVKYKKEKMRKYKMLRQKTKKGQPVMAGRLELLLEKIQKSIGS